MVTINVNVVDISFCLSYNKKDGEESLNPSAPRYYNTHYIMKNQRRRDFFCFDTIKSTNWNRDGVSMQECTALVALLLNVNAGGIVYASQTNLAESVGCSRPTLTKGLNSLIERGLVFKVEGKRAQYRISESIGTKLV
jgi:DNA-binding MarR family transcriptional regulator